MLCRLNTKIKKKSPRHSACSFEQKKIAAAHYGGRAFMPGCDVLVENIVVRAGRAGVGVGTTPWVGFNVRFGLSMHGVSGRA